MRKNIFIIMFVALAILCFFNTEKAYTESIKCHPGYVKSGYWCKNPTNSLSYLKNADEYRYYLNDVYCGTDCNPDGTNCKRGVCDKKELASYGFTETKGDKFYNPAKHLSYKAIYREFYIDDILCGYDCDLNGRNCRSGSCDKKELASYGFTEMKNGKFYNPITHLAYYARFNEFFLDDVQCGSECDLFGKNCKRGICDKNILVSHGFTEIKDGKFFNPNTKLSLTGSAFYLNGNHCGNGCNFDGTDCESGFCNVKNCQNGYTEIKNGYCYNPKTHLSYNSSGYFYADGVQCGYKCNFNGSNCQKGKCNFDAIAAHGYTEKWFKPDYTYHLSSGNKFYNANTHIAFEGDDFFLENIPCGYKCDLEGRNCEKGVCVVADCANGYKNLGIITIGTWNTNYLIPSKDYTKSVICHNNAKYYNVFEPDIIKSVILKNVEHF